MAAQASTVLHGSHRLAEWALWVSGLTGSVITLAFGTIATAFAHGASPGGSGGSSVEVQLAAITVPPAIHLTSIAAAVGLARVRPWAVQLGWVVAVLLLVGLPVGLLKGFTESTPVAEVWIPDLIRRQVFGMAFMPLPLVQAALGAVVLYDLRRRRAIVTAAIPDGPRPGHVARAGAIMIAFGLWQLGLLIAATLQPYAPETLSRHLSTYLIATVAIAAFGVVVGLGIRSERRWAVPATLGIIPAAISAYVTTSLVLPLLVLGGAEIDGPNPVVLAANWAGLPVFGLLGLYTAASVYQARRRFVRP